MVTNVITGNELKTEKQSTDSNDVINQITGNPIRTEKYDPNINNVSETPINIKFDIDSDTQNILTGSVPWQAPPYQAKPGFFETVGKKFVESSQLNPLLHFISDEEINNNPLDNNVPENYNAADNLENFNGIKKENYGFILGAQGPQDAIRRRYYVLDRQQEQDYLSRGSTIGQLVGGAAGMTVGSPINWLPIATALKYPSIAQNILRNSGRVAGSLTASSIGYEAWKNTLDTGGNLHDFAVNSAIDSIFSVAFMGAGYGLAAGYRAAKMAELKPVMKMLYDGIDVKPLIAKDGTVLKQVAMPSYGFNVSAAKVDEAQAFLDSKMAQKGLFAIPYLGKYIGKGFGQVVPVIRMLNSRYTTTAGFADRLGDHGILTEGNLRGVASPDKFETKMARFNEDNKLLMTQMKGYHLERNGINPSDLTSGIQELKMKWGKNGYVSEENFNDEVIQTLISETPHANGVVNEAAAYVRKQVDDIYRAFRKAYDLPENWLPPKTAAAYLMRVYNEPYLSARRDVFVDVVSNYLKEADAEITERLRPINEFKESIIRAEESHAKLARSKKATDEQIKKSSDALKAMKTRHKVMQEKLQDELRENEKLRIHLDDWGGVSAKEAKSINKLKEPLLKIEKELNTQKDILAKMRIQKSKKKQQVTKAKTKGTAGKQAQAEDKTVQEISQQEKIVKEWQDKYDTEFESLQERMHNGEIDPSLFFRLKGSYRYALKDPNDRLKFRDVYESDYHREQAANAYYDTIMNQNAQNTIDQIMGKLLGRHAENPLKERTLLVPDEVLYNNNLLSKNLAANVMNYRSMLARRTFMKQVYSDVTLDGGMDMIGVRLNNEFKLEEEKYLSQIRKLKKQKKQTKETEDKIEALRKEIESAKKEYKRDVEDIKKSYEKAMARTQSSYQTRKWNNIARNFATSVLLGATPLTQITDLFAIPMKHGLWPTIRDGLIPILTNIHNQIKQGKGEYYKQNAAHAYLALNHINAGYAERNTLGSQQTYVGIGGKLANGTETLAHLSNNLAGTNMIDNFLQRLTAAMYQSQIVRHMLDYEAGKLSERDLQKLLLYGLDPKVWSQRIIKGWKEAGSDSTGLGSYLSHYWKWSDIEASNKFSEVLYRATKDTVIRRGMLDAPFALDNPFVGTFAMFKGWSMAALARYTAPLMQNPADRDMLLGAMLMLSAGAMVTPLRRLAKGEDPIQDDDNMFINAMLDGGVLTAIFEPLENINQLLGGALWKDIGNDRFRNRSIAGILAGPIAGIGDNLVQVARMIATRNYNQADIKRMLRLFPASQPFYLRGLTNKMVESLDYPETYGEAKRQNE